MALPEYATPVIAVVGAPALAYAIARSLWHFACATVVLVASFVAIKTKDKDRRESCLAIVDKVVTCRDGGPPEPGQPPRRAIRRGRSSR